MSEGPHPRFARPLPAGEVEETGPFTSPAGRGRRAAAGEGLLTSPAGRGRRAAAGEGLVSRAGIVAAARAWLGTPYVHQASAKGQGTDCLGLLRGLYAELCGREPEAPPPYTPDWNETRSDEEPLLSAARRHLREGPHPSRCARRPLPAGEVKKGAPLSSPLPEGEVARSTGEGLLTSPAGRGRAEGAGEGLILPGQILIFRIVTDGPAKHCGVAVSADHFIHAYAGRAVIESWLTRWWMERLAGVFEFPGVEE